MSTKNAARRPRRSFDVSRHQLPVCEATGMSRYRDRHQARDGAKALVAGAHTFEVSTFACPDCRGYHVEKTYLREPIAVGPVTAPTEAFVASLTERKRRYFLVDVENATYGARVSCEQLADFWRILKEQAPGIAPHDHVVVGAARRVVRKYRAAISGSNVKWVVGPDAPDGADQALLAAIDLRRVAREYDEVVIVSGDHAFADLARRAKWMGLTVHVVTAQHPEQYTMLSRELATVADTRTRVRLHAIAPRHAKVTPLVMPTSRNLAHTQLQPSAA